MGAPLDSKDKNDHTAMDIAVIMMNYNAALVLKKNGLDPR